MEKSGLYFEHTELFQRGVGETTDIVQKEMYSFQDKKGRNITLNQKELLEQLGLILSKNVCWYSAY